MTRLTVYIGDAELAALKREHAESYAQHRQSFNRWAVARLMREDSIERLERRLEGGERPAPGARR